MHPCYQRYLMYVCAWVTRAQELFLPTGEDTSKR